jgi:hypothetical protein
MFWTHMKESLHYRDYVMMDELMGVWKDERLMDRRKMNKWTDYVTARNVCGADEYNFL